MQCIAFTQLVHSLFVENMTLINKSHCLAFPGKVYKQIRNVVLPRQSLAFPLAQRALLSHVVVVGRMFNPRSGSIGRQEQSIVPPVPALLHIHTLRGGI